MEKNLNIFKSIDTNNLKSIGQTEKPVDNSIKDINIDKEFFDTTSHTKQTLDFTDNTDKGENQDKVEQLGTDSAVKTKNSLGKILPAKIALTMADKIIPSLLILILYYLNLQVDKKKLQLTKDEINELIPAVQDCLDAIKIDMDNPFTTLGVMIGIVYGSKIIDAIPEITKKEIKKEFKNIDQKLDSIINDDEEKTSNREKFEADYNALVEEIKTKRNRGIKDAKAYIADMFPEKIKRLGEKYKQDVTEELNFVHLTPSQRKQEKEKDKPFDLPPM